MTTGTEAMTAFLRSFLTMECIPEKPMIGSPDNAARYIVRTPDRLHDEERKGERRGPFVPMPNGQRHGLDRRACPVPLSLREQAERHREIVAKGMKTESGDT